MTIQQARFEAEYLRTQLGAKWPSARFEVKESAVQDSGSVQIYFRDRHVADFRDQSRCRIDNVRRVLVSAVTAS